MSKPVRRLFVDPASRATGWALFEDKQCIEHGAIVAGGNDAFLRMHDLYLDYFELGDRLQPDECYLEQFRVYSTKRGGLVIGSVYVIGAALRCYSEVGWVWTQHWQEFAGYKKGQPPKGRLKKFEDEAASEDVLAAIGMGLWYTEKKA